MNEFIEQRIITAVRRLLTGRVNELLSKTEYAIPLVEFGGYEGTNVVAPVITLGSCESTEKERIIRLDAYSLVIGVTFAETSESELYCYAFAGTISRAFYDNPTLGGVVDRAFVTSKKITPPKKKNCGGEWELTVTLRITVEGIQK